MYSLLHLECHPISISNLNLVGLFPIKLAKRDLEDTINKRFENQVPTLQTR